LPAIKFDRRLHLGPAADPFLEGWQERDPLKQATYAAVATSERAAKETGGEVADAMAVLLAQHRGDSRMPRVIQENAKGAGDWGSVARR
jgi:hypothetical protein